MNLMPKLVAAKLMLILLSVVTAFHISVLIGVVPYTIVWAGKLKSLEEMYVFESISIAINLFLMAVILQRFRFLRPLVNDGVLDFILWLFVLLFSLNTIGNLFSKSIIELILGITLTLVSALLCWVMVRKEE
jgi:hypothetical protein